MNGSNGRLLITGGSGLLAVNWAAARRDRQPVTLGLHRRPLSLQGVTVHAAAIDTESDAGATIDAVRPDIVVHSAAMTNIEACEADPAAAYHVNVEVAAHVASACAARRVALVHISTDHLFPGDAPMSTESTPVKPVNTYGRTKAAAEERVGNAHPDALIVRTNFYGWGTRYRTSFSDKIVHALRARQAVTLFDDVFFTPILAAVLAHAAHDLLDARSSGIINVAGDDRITKHEFGLRLADRFALDRTLIKAGRLRDTPALAPRPNDMSLSNDACRARLHRPLGGIDAQLNELREQERMGLAQELYSR